MPKDRMEEVLDSEGVMTGREIVLELDLEEGCVWAEFSPKVALDLMLVIAQWIARVIDRSSTKMSDKGLYLDSIRGMSSIRLSTGPGC